MKFMEGKNNKIKEEPIYEKLAPKEVLLISKADNYIVYAVNEDGKLAIKKAFLD